MKFKLFRIVTIIFFGSCSTTLSKQTHIDLGAQAFASKIEALPNALVLDVRTPEEYAKGHLNDAINIDWNDNDFENKVSTIDTSKPVFVYCLSGARSTSAAIKMSTLGFSTIYQLEGGILKWRGANLPETNTTIQSGMTRAEFDVLLNTDKDVLIDFYAEWCGPCREMKPYLSALSDSLAQKLVIIRINADDNQALCKSFKIDALPVLQLYKKQSLVWTHTGFIDKQSLLKHL